jgi:hypothetical protein
MGEKALRRDAISMRLAAVHLSPHAGEGEEVLRRMRPTRAPGIPMQRAFG